MDIHTSLQQVLQNIIWFAAVFDPYHVRKILGSQDFKRRTAIKTGGHLIDSDAEKIFLEILFYFFYRAIKNLCSLVEQYNMITDLFHLFHTMRAKNDRSTFLCKSIYFVFDDIGVYRIKTAERFIQYDKFRLVQHHRDKLELLRHTF